MKLLEKESVGDVAPGLKVRKVDLGDLADVPGVIRVLL